MLTRIFGITAILAMVTAASASASVRGTASVAERGDFTKPWSVLAAVSVASSLYQFGNESRLTSGALRLNTAYRLSPAWTASAGFGVTRSLNRFGEWLVNDGTFAGSWSGVSLSPGLRFGAAVITRVPLSEASRKFDNLLTAVTLAPSLAWNLRDLGAASLNLRYGLTVTRAFHRYRTAATGRSLKQYNLGNAVSLSWHPLPQWQLGAGFSLSRGWTYQGKPSDNFGLEQSIVWTPASDISLSAFHRNGGDVLAANGQDNAIAFVNQSHSDSIMPPTHGPAAGLCHEHRTGQRQKNCLCQIRQNIRA